MPRQLRVIDGADHGRTFPLPESGTVRIGNGRSDADICLHDLYVGYTHCELAITPERVAVTDKNSPHGTLVNGQKITEHELRQGDVLRVGNSHLRLEEGDAAAPPKPESSARSPEEPGKLPRLPAERLGELGGRTLGHFKLGAALGWGQCGVVFHALDAKTEQAVALKVLPPTFPADDAEMQHFVRAMRPAVALHHPGLVGLRGLGRTGPYVWIAAELVEGESAASAVVRFREAGKGKWRLSLRVAVHIARALDVLHQRRLVHANITPANLLLTGGDGAAKLADLGLWDALMGSALQRERLEQKLLAELPYLSPEHIDPEAPVDDLSDQYSLGAVVYALLTGRPPCEGKTPEETMARVRETMPLRPKEFQKSTPDELQAAVLRMLAKRPEERYAGPGPLVADLEAIAARHGEKV